MNLKISYLYTNSIRSNQANVIQVLEMCNALSQLDTEVVLCLPDYNVSDEEIYSRIKEKIGVNDVHFKIRKYKPSTFFGRGKQYLAFIPLSKIVFEEKDTFYFIRFQLLCSILGMFNRKFIYEAHQILEKDLLNKLLRPLFLRNINQSRVKLFICISHALMEWYKKNGVTRPIVVLHDAVNVEQFTPRYEAVYYKKKLNIDENKIVFTYAGSLYRERKTEIVCDCAEKFPQYLFHIIGGAAEDQMVIKNMILERSLSNVKIVGYLGRKALLEYLWASDYLLMLWSNEVKTIEYCSPLKTFEYMSTQRTIIGHGFRTIREVLENGVDALLFAPDQPEKLFQIIEKISLINNSGLAINAYHKVKTNFTWNGRSKEIISRLIQ